jgi:broad specificity phosphatase PhoE
VAQRLVVVAHGATGGLRESIFGDPGHVLDAAAIPPVRARFARWFQGPEVASAETAARLGGPGQVIPRLRSCDFGSWTGRSLANVGATEPKGVRQWLADPHAKPHGGESLSELILRVGAAVDQSGWPEGQSIVVVTPLVARAIAVHAIGASPETIFRIDISPLGRVKVSRSTSSWRLRFDQAADL